MCHQQAQVCNEPAGTPVQVNLLLPARLHIGKGNHACLPGFPPDIRLLGKAGSAAMPPALRRRFSSLILSTSSPAAKAMALGGQSALFMGSRKVRSHRLPVPGAYVAPPLPLPLAAAGGWELEAALPDRIRSATASVDAGLLGLNDRLTLSASVTEMSMSTAFCLAPVACLTASAVLTKATRRASCDSVIALPSRLHVTTLVVSLLGTTWVLVRPLLITAETPQM